LSVLGVLNYVCVCIILPDWTGLGGWIFWVDGGRKRDLRCGGAMLEIENAKYTLVYGVV